MEEWRETKCVLYSKLMFFQEHNVLPIYRFIVEDYGPNFTGTLVNPIVGVHVGWYIFDLLTTKSIPMFHEKKMGYIVERV